MKRVLIETWASCDIMDTGLFKTLQLTESNLAPYVGTELYGFYGSSTKPRGYVELLLTFRGWEQDEDNKDPIFGDRSHLPLQLHHRDDWTGAAWGRMLNCTLKAKVSCRQKHNNYPVRRLRGCLKMFPPRRINSRTRFPSQSSLLWMRGKLLRVLWSPT